MDPDEFEDYVNSLPPEEQQQVMAELGLSDVNSVPMSYGGASPGSMFAPELTPQSYDLGTMNQMPPDIKYGDLQPNSMDVRRDFYNATQDRGALAFDTAVTALTAGAGGFYEPAFQPSTIPIGSPIDQTGRRYVEGLAGSEGGYMSYLAKKIRRGIDPSAAVAEMWAEINAADAPEAQDKPEVLAQAANLRASLPPNTSMDAASLAPSNLSGGGSPDLTSIEGRAAAVNLDAINTTANDLYEKWVSDPQIGYTDPQTGLGYAGAYQQPSEMTQKFHDYGLPTPFEQYSDESFLPQVGQQSIYDQMSRQQAGQQRVNRTDRALDVARSNYNTQEKAWADSEDERAALAEQGPMPAAPLPPEGVEQPLPAIPGTTSAAANNYDEFTTPIASGLPTGQPVQYDDQNFPGDEQAAYDTAYSDWEDEKKRREEQGTANPYLIKSGKKILDTYNFGGTAQEQENVAALMEGLYTYAGKPNVEVGEMGSNWEPGYGDAYHNAYEAQQNAQDWAYQQNQIRTPEQLDRAGSVMTAYAMQRAGRTPMQDMMMQRSMGLSTLDPYRGY